MIQKFQDNNIPKGLLAFAPFFLAITSLSIGFSAGLIVFGFLIFLMPMNYFLRKLIPPQQRLVFVLVISVSWMLIVRMLLEAEVYSLVEKTGLFLPLLIMNSMILSMNETIYSMPGLKSVMINLFSVGIAILIFLMMLGILRELLNNVSIFSSSSGCLFISGFLFATINFLKIKKVYKH